MELVVWGDLAAIIQALLFGGWGRGPDHPGQGLDALFHDAVETGQGSVHEMATQGSAAVQGAITAVALLDPLGHSGEEITAQGPVALAESE